jgi:hypothetical protein
MGGSLLLASSSALFTPTLLLQMSPETELAFGRLLMK